MSPPNRLVPWLSRGLVLLAIVWVGWLIWQEAPQFTSQIRAINGGWLVVSLLLGVISIFFNAPVYYLVLNVHSPAPVRFQYAIYLNFVSQMVRHIPGRFWGVVYQVNETRHQIPSSVMVKINIDYTLIYLAFNLLVPITILLFHWIHPAAAVLFLVIGFVLYTFFLRLNWMHILLSFLHQRLPSRYQKRLSSYLEQNAPTYSWQTSVNMGILLIIAWAFYLMAWLTFSRVFAGLSTANLLLLAASYALAWFVGFISMLTPAGLGVREAVFVFFANLLTITNSVGFLAVFVRIWLLAIDFILFTVGITIKLLYERKRNVESTSGV